MSELIGRQDLVMISEHPPVVYGSINGAPDLKYAGDFSPMDPWSQFASSTLRQLEASGLFSGRHFIELGSGDGRNGWQALNYGVADGGREASHYTAVELDSWRDRLAGENAEQLKLEGKITRHVGDAVAWLNDSAPGFFEESVVFACLPQVPASSETQSTSDGVVAQESFGNIGDTSLGELTVAQAGLTLVAASLKSLREKVTPESGVDALYAISGRLPALAIARLFMATGWEQVRLYPTDGPVPQDIDTSVSIFERMDDGYRFFDNSGRPLTARAAEERRYEALRARMIDAEAPLPDSYPYHYISIHHLRVARHARGG